MQSNSTHILLARCPDRAGLSASITALLASAGADITDSQQHADADTGLFFLRIAFHQADTKPLDRDHLESRLASLAAEIDMAWWLPKVGVRPKVLVAVSRFSHCLNDLLYRWRTDTLPVDIVGVLSNHEDMRSLVEWHGVPYFFLPVSPKTKKAQEASILDLVASLDVDLVVLARYMQVLSDDLASKLSGRCINIHHSFLPSFKGAKPYHQAHERGVKIIGATAHYVTAALDEGPIIEQDIERVDHAQTPDQLVEIGRDIEARVLGRAVKWHAEYRVLLNGSKTVVFR